MLCQILVTLIVTVCAGAHVSMEMEVRLFLRNVFVDPCKSTVDKAFWLTRILKPWPLIHQARLMYLLFGPTHEG